MEERYLQLVSFPGACMYQVYARRCHTSLILLNPYCHVLSDTLRVMKLLLFLNLVLSHIHYASSMWRPSLSVQFLSCEKNVNRTICLAFLLQKFPITYTLNFKSVY